MARTRHEFSPALKALAACLGFTALAGSAHADVLRLEEVEQRALGAHPSLAAQGAKIQRAEAEVELAQSSRGPTIVGRLEGSLAPGGQLIRVQNQNDPINAEPYLVSGARTLGDPKAFIPQPRYAAGFGATGTLFDFGRSSLQVEAARAKVGAEQAGVDEVKRQLVLDVRGAYAGWLKAEQSLQIASAQLERLKTWRTTIEQLIGEGARPSSDAALARYEEQRGELGALRARAARDLARAALEATAQSDLPETATPDVSLLEEPSADSAATATRAAALDDESTSRMLERQQRAATSAARALDTNYAPVIGGAAELGVRGQNSSFFPAYRVGVTLTVPIWDGGEQSARAAMAHADAEQLGARLRQAQRARRDQEKLAATRETLASEEMKLALSALQTAETLSQQAEERYQLGGAGIEPVLDAQRTLVSAQLDVLEARINRLSAKLKLAPRTSAGPSGS